LRFVAFSRLHHWGGFELHNLFFWDGAGLVGTRGNGAAIETLKIQPGLQLILQRTGGRAAAGFKLRSRQP
jgi:hypothetical protein